MSKQQPKIGAVTCPVCGKPPDEPTRPFCSKRCADVDLSRWLKGSYAIPAVEPPDELDNVEGEGEIIPGLGQDSGDNGPVH
ncbi:MAG TPA: DNA gyrase inhibitor YacG [Rhizomicrobium sp.]|nr:DNA gyrase inhibitor YacG [Rhizomicrobium sp.]